SRSRAKAKYVNKSDIYDQDGRLQAGRKGPSRRRHPAKFSVLMELRKYPLTIGNLGSFWRCRVPVPNQAPAALFCVPACRPGAHLTRSGAGAMAKTSDTRSGPEGADGEEGKAAPAKRKLSLKLIIIAVGGLVGLGAIGGGAYHFLFAGHG